jgi:O-antigen/teichoic acid export membrane protein
MRKTTDGLIKHSGIMVMSTIIANISLLFFHVYMSRALGPASFGILVSFLAICFIVGLPVTSIQTVIAKYVSNFKVNNQYGKTGYLFRHSLRKMSLYGGLGLGLFILASAKIGSFLQIEARKPVMLLGVVLFLSLFLPIVRGALQGLQKFGHLGTNVLFEGTSRLLLSCFLVYLGLGVSGAVGGIGLGFLLVVLLAFVPLRSLFRHEKSIEGKIHSAEIYAYFWPVSLALLCFVLLTNMDMIFVKHFFNPTQAGYYSALSVVGRGFLTLALAVSMVMFPKVSELETQKKDSSSILKKSLLICVFLCSVGILICFFFPRFIIVTVFGSKYLNISSLLRVFGIAISPLMVLHLLINYNLARYRTKFLYVLVFGVVFYVILLSLFHSSLKQVVLILGSVGTLTLILNIGLVVCQDEKIVRGVSI